MPQFEFIPCTCRSRHFCGCLTEDQTDNHIYRKHWEDIWHDKNKHDEFNGLGNGYYKVEKPTWKYNCKLKLSVIESYFVDFLCSLFKLSCECTTLNVCKLCKHLCPAKKSTPPVLYIDFENQLTLERLKTLHPYIQKVLL